MQSKYTYFTSDLFGFIEGITVVHKDVGAILVEESLFVFRNLAFNFARQFSSFKNPYIRCSFPISRCNIHADTIPQEGNLTVEATKSGKNFSFLFSDEYSDSNHYHISGNGIC